MADPHAPTAEGHGATGPAAGVRQRLAERRGGRAGLDAVLDARQGGDPDQVLARRGAGEVLRQVVRGQGRHHPALLRVLHRDRLLR